MTKIHGSSNVVGVTHDPQRNILTVKFKGGGIYDYGNVTKAQHAALITSESRGSWIAENLVRKPTTHPATKQEAKPEKSAAKKPACHVLGMGRKP